MDKHDLQHIKLMERSVFIMIWRLRVDREALSDMTNLPKMNKMNTENDRFPTFSVNASNYAALQCLNPVYYSHRRSK
jgi:hypothetical protein